MLAGFFAFHNIQRQRVLDVVNRLHRVSSEPKPDEIFSGLEQNIVQKKAGPRLLSSAMLTNSPFCAVFVSTTRYPFIS